MRLIKTFGRAAFAAVAAMAFVGATAASATFDTQFCKVNEGLLCPAGQAETHIHRVLKAGTVARLLAAVTVLCLGVLSEEDVLGLGKPQVIHAKSVGGLSFSGCGTGSAHNNCTVTVQEAPLYHLLKIGPGEGALTFLSGRKRVQCPNVGIDCVYDLAGSEFAVANNLFIANEAPSVELGGKFFCPDEALFDAELESLLASYIKS
ncbi:MAG TPA: hypothetical protein VF093_01510 [Solirubrobacterales bacterium]